MMLCTVWRSRIWQCGQPAHASVGTTLAFCDEHAVELIKNVPVKTLAIIRFRETA